MKSCLQYAVCEYRCTCTGLTPYPSNILISGRFIKVWRGPEALHTLAAALY